MSDITKEKLEKEINAILKDADLAAMSTKKVREQLEKKWKCDLNSRREEIKEIVMDIVNARDAEDSESASSQSEEEEEDKKPVPKTAKRASTARKAPPPKKKPKKAAAASEEDEAESSEADNKDDDADSDYNGTAAKKSTPKGKKKGGRRKKGSDSDSDEDWKQAKRPKKAKGAGGKGRGTGFTRPYQLSAELASVVGAESLPRYEVVKKIWTIIKERNLYDPKNKHFVICDSDQLTKIFGVKRFRAFSMLKYLKPHFID